MLSLAAIGRILWIGQMNFYAHTADDGRQWQPLDSSLARRTGEGAPGAGEGRNVAELSEKFAASFGMAADVRLGVSLHDFQTRNKPF